ncbi:flippase [Blautia obeum]|uniref:flippase n=1 Tax=Blautia obeum TaxID=40520 RepID=UPI003F8AB650
MSSLKKNFLLQVSYQILNICLPFVTSPYISRVFGTEGLGIYSYTYSIASVFVLFINLGIDNYGSRGVAIRKDNKYELNCFVSELCALRLFIGIIPIVIYLWYSIVFGDPKEIYLLQSLILFGTVLNINWCFFGLEKFDITVTRNFIFKFLTVICVFVFVKNSDDLWKYTLIMAAGTVISQSVVWVFFPKYFHFVKTSVSGIVKHVKPLLVLFTAVLANSAYTYIDKIMIGWLGTKSQLGICDNSYKIISFPMGIITALGVVMLPRMSYLYSNSDEDKASSLLDASFKYLMILAIAMAFGIAAVADTFSVVFWGSDFWECGIVISITSVSCIFMTWNEILRSQYLIPKSLDKIYSSAIVIGAIVSISFDAVLVPILGAEGAATAMSLSYFSISLYQSIKIRKMLSLRKYIFALIPYVAFGIFMYVCVKVTEKLMPAYTVISLFAMVIVGTGIYILLSFVYLLTTKDKVALKIIERVARNNGKN